MKKHNQELDIDEDLVLERRTWAFERTGWLFMLLFVLAALLGFTGRGGIATINDQTAGSKAAGIEVKYERFLRREAPANLQVRLYGQENQVRFSKEFYEKVRVEQVVPEPELVHVTDESIIYTFEKEAEQALLAFYLKPQKSGSLHITIANSNTQLNLSQFVYP